MLRLSLGHERAPELWGGVECSVNRTGATFGDQLQVTGHHAREEDLDRIASLGLDALRYPVLWERIAPETACEYDWEWTDRRLARLRELGIRPIAGLVHHGSGPRYTSLIDADFASKLAVFALAAARRYPYIEEWTPINEPLTTARFACLYGHWYPHARNERLFWEALLNQIDGVRMAMRAIRTTVPHARLVQTEDLGRTYAVSALHDQAAFDNARRWMTWDLLVGAVEPGHQLWDRLASLGFEPRLRAIVDDPCPPDTIGINHYLTSDRFLDHRIQRYPAQCRGSNGRQAYADIEAIRVLEPPPGGLSGAIREAWERYRRPVALTEVHNGCSREEQLRWFRDAWTAACAARRDGVSLRAVTSWALFGSSGWNTLLTGPGCYEPGAFDVRSAPPRATAVADLLRQVRGEGPLHPVATGAGWWRRDVRLKFEPGRTVSKSAAGRGMIADSVGPPLLITGATGTLGRAVAAACRHRGLAHVLTDRAALDLADDASIARALALHEPWAVVNCAGWVKVDMAEDEVDGCMGANAKGAAALARASADRGLPTVNFSSDLVFDGAKSEPYVESDSPNPLNVYGHSKVALEHAIAALPGDHLVVRSAAFFSPFDQANFAFRVACALHRSEPILAASDLVISPTYVPHLCDAVLDLLIDGENGVWHLTSGEAVSWHGFGERLAVAFARNPELIVASPASELGLAARRPRASALKSARGPMLPPLSEAIAHYCTTRQAAVIRRAVCS